MELASDLAIHKEGHFVDMTGDKGETDAIKEQSAALGLDSMSNIIEQLDPNFVLVKIHNSINLPDPKAEFA